jgi:hypothetical protein
MRLLYLSVPISKILKQSGLVYCFFLIILFSHINLCFKSSQSVERKCFEGKLFLEISARIFKRLKPDLGLRIRCLGRE